MLPVDRLGQELRPGDAVRNRSGAAAALMALAFLVLGACLALAGRGMLADAGVRREKTDLGTLYVPESLPETSVIGHGEDGHDHFFAVPGSTGGVLILSDRLDGSDALAAELARRGLTVLRAGKSADPGEAWDRLLSAENVRLSSVGLMASAGRASEAFALAESLAGSGRECACVILLAEGKDLPAMADFSCRDLLVITRGKADREELVSFFGSREEADRGFAGYFGEGTARAAADGGVLCSFARRRVMLRVIDWQGSALGHPVGLADSDLIYGEITFCRIAAGVCALLAATFPALHLRRRRSGACKLQKERTT